MAVKNSAEPLEPSSVSTKQTVAQEQTSAAQSTNRQDKQSPLATMLVGLLIVASGLLVYNYFQSSTAPATTSIADQEQNQSDTQSSAPPSTDEPVNLAGQGSYIVQAGDSLWTIAERIYGQGEKWSVLDSANRLPKDGQGRPLVEVGQVLVAPDSAASTAISPNPDTAQIADQSIQTVSGHTYVVQSGDTLWGIAEQAYGDGQQWHKIYTNPTNRLGSLPNGQPLIHSGNILQL